MKIEAKLYPGYDLAMNVTVKHDPGCGLAYDCPSQTIPCDMFGGGYGLVADNRNDK